MGQRSVPFQGSTEDACAGSFRQKVSLDVRLEFFPAPRFEAIQQRRRDGVAVEFRSIERPARARARIV